MPKSLQESPPDVLDMQASNERTGRLDSGDGVERRVPASRSRPVVVRFRFGENGVGALHHHVHIRSTYVPRRDDFP